PAPNAKAPPPGPHKSALPLFDPSGNQILVNNPDGTNNSLVDNFVFANGGEYFIAVSASNNVAYDPRTVGSGVIAGTTGTYTLTLSLAPGVSDAAQVLNGNAVSV